MIADEGTKKFAASNFLHFQMIEEKSITSQIHKFHNIVAKLAKEGDGLLESFVTQCLVEKYQSIGRSTNSISSKKRLL